MKARSPARRHSVVGSAVRVATGMTVLLVVFLQLRGCQERPPFGPVTDRDYRNRGRADPRFVELGRLLFFDEELSGNRNISCATCHDPKRATTDGLSLPVGEGGQGLGTNRRTGGDENPVRRRVARNAPALFNLGARQFRSLFADGRVAVGPRHPHDDKSDAVRFVTPAGDDLPAGLDSLLAAQALFPLTCPTEMAGHAGENEVADAVAAGQIAGSGGAWDRLAARLRAIPEYVQRFSALDDVRSADDVTIVHVANALAAFQATAFRSDQSAFDRYLRGESGGLNATELRGMKLFYGGGRCSRCHAGPFQTDQQFHSIGMPQIGPGTGGGSDGRDDYGRENVTGDPRHRYRFRTPSLRNVELTGPWGHAGAFGSLQAVVEHYRDHGGPEPDRYDTEQAVLPELAVAADSDFAVMHDPLRVHALTASSQARSLQLSQLRPDEIADLVAFLKALTDPRMRDLSRLIPNSVPSGRMTKQR